MKRITNEQAQEWVSVAIEAAEQQAEGGCKCATCQFLVALNETRREPSDSPRKSKR